MSELIVFNAQGVVARLMFASDSRAFCNAVRRLNRMGYDWRAQTYLALGD